MLRRIDASFWWWIVRPVAVCLLPWNMLQDGFTAGSALALFATDADSASALGQALFHRRWWFWPVVAALAIAACVVPSIAEQARCVVDLLLAGGWLGLVAIVAQGWFIGVHGWSYDALTQVFGELNDRQFGMGWGGCITFAMLCRADHDGACVAWTVRRRPLCRRRRRSAGGLDPAFHRLAGADDSRTGVVRACRSGDGRGIPRAIFPAEDLECRLLSFESVMRRCLEHAGARHRDGNRVHAARPCLCPGRDPHRLPFQAAAPASHGPADHYAAVRDRAWAHPDLRPFRPDQSMGRQPVRCRTRSLDIRLQRRLAGAGVFIHADGFSGPDRRRPGHLADHGGSLADAARQSGAYVCQHHVAPDAAGIGQCLARRLHREPGGFRQSHPARRLDGRAVDRDLLRGGRRPGRFRPRRHACDRVADLRAGRFFRPAQHPRQAILCVDDGQGRWRPPDAAAGPR